MMPLPSARRAEDFAASLEGRTPTRPLDAETASLVVLVQALRDVEPVEVRATFASDLRSRLVSEAEQVLVTAPTRHRAAPPTTPSDVRRRRLTSLVAAACVTIGAGAGVAAASQSALPGEALYPVKRGIERIELTLSGSGKGHGEELLEQAGTRVVEAQDLTVQSPDDPQAAAHVGEALQDFRSQATAGGEELIRVYEDDADDDAIVVLRTFVSDSGARLDSLAGSVPPEAQDDLSAAADALTDLDAAARAACPTCSELAPLQLSGAVMSLRTDVESLISGDDERQQPGGRLTRPDEPSGQQPRLRGVTPPTGALPTLPEGGTTADGETAGGAEGGPPGVPAAGPTDQPDLTDDVGDATPRVDLGGTTVTLPPVPEPSAVVPTVVEPVESALESVETILEPAETILDDPLDVDPPLDLDD